MLASHHGYPGSRPVHFVCCLKWHFSRVLQPPRPMKLIAPWLSVLIYSRPFGSHSSEIQSQPIDMNMLKCDSTEHWHMQIRTVGSYCHTCISFGFFSTHIWGTFNFLFFICLKFVYLFFWVFIKLPVLSQRSIVRVKSGNKMAAYSLIMPLTLTHTQSVELYPQTYVYKNVACTDICGSSWSINKWNT
jgi:hypothetical protein